jgi:hypothetical protein
MAIHTARYIMVFITILLSIGINFGQQALLSLNYDHNYLVMTLVAIVAAGLLVHRHLFIVVLVCGLSFAINLPAEMLQQYYVNRDILLGTLFLVILVPAFKKYV